MEGAREIGRTHSQRRSKGMQMTPTERAAEMMNEAENNL